MAVKKNNTLLDIVFSVLLPSLVLMKLSNPEQLGAFYALVLALLFPLAWGGYELWQSKKVNFIAALGLVSVILTGGIGLFEVDTFWLAVKEAAIPGVIAIIVIASNWTAKPLVQRLLLDTGVFNTELIEAKLHEHGNSEPFAKIVRKANWVLAGSFTCSSVLNFVLARWLVTAPTGSEQFNEQLAQMTLLSYPIIALPSTLLLMGVMIYLFNKLNELTLLSFDELLN